MGKFIVTAGNSLGKLFSLCLNLIYFDLFDPKPVLS